MFCLSICRTNFSDCLLTPAPSRQLSMFRSHGPERCVEKLQIGVQKQILPQLDPVDFKVHDLKEAQLSLDRRRHAT
jgi:hypothetical protein